MKNYRIVVLSYEHPLAGMKRIYALQKRIGIFFWYTVAKCDSLEQCKTVHKNTKDKKERVINVIRTI